MIGEKTEVQGAECFAKIHTAGEQQRRSKPESEFQPDGDKTQVPVPVMQATHEEQKSYRSWGRWGRFAGQVRGSSP